MWISVNHVSWNCLQSLILSRKHCSLLVASPKAKPAHTRKKSCIRQDLWVDSGEVLTFRCGSGGRCTGTPPSKSERCSSSQNSTHTKLILNCQMETKIKANWSQLKPTEANWSQLKPTNNHSDHWLQHLLRYGSLRLQQLLTKRKGCPGEWHKPSALLRLIFFHKPKVAI